MFRSVKLKSLRILFLSLIGVLLIVSIVFVAVRGSTNDTMEINGERISLSAESEADVDSFLTACGYDDPAFLFEQEITVPKHWNETYEAYSELQRRQGFDLLPYKGKPATEYVYFVSDTLNAVVLTNGNKIIAAHVSECDGSEMRMLPREDDLTLP